MSDSDRILLFIPCYNCEPQIGRVVARFDERVRAHVSEVLVVDNGSKDGTRTAAAEALRRSGVARWRVVLNDQNYSLGGSHKVAFDYAIEHGFTHVIVLHGDDQADIRDFLPALQQGLHRKFQSLLGARFMRGAHLQGYSLSRIIGNYGLNTICSVLAGASVVDAGSGLNMYTVSYLRDRFYEDFEDNLIFPAMMLFYGIFSRSKYIYVPITWREEDQRSNAKAVRQALQIIGLLRPRDPRLLPPAQPKPPSNRGFKTVEQFGS